MQEEKQPSLLKVSEIAALTRLSKMTIYRLINSGDIPHMRIGRSFRVWDFDLGAYLDSKEENVT